VIENQPPYDDSKGATSSREAKMRDRVRQNAERALNDEKFNWIRTPGRRKAIAITALAMVFVTSGLYLIAGTWGFVGLLGLYVSYALLRVSIRSIADLPEEFVDERLRQVRSATYYRAYLASYVLLTGVAVVLMILWIGHDIGTSGNSDFVTLKFTWDQLQALVWFVLGLAMVTPSAVLALTQSDKIH
jgi:hypothetical protein